MRRLLMLPLLAAAALWAQTNPEDPAVFPTAVADYERLPLASNRAYSTLTAPIDDDDLVIPVADGSVFVAPSLLTLGTEQVLICSIDVNDLTVCTDGRGVGGTTALGQSAGVLIEDLSTATHWNRVLSELIAIQTALGANLENVGAAANSLTQADEFDEEGAFPVSAGATGRATQQSCWRQNTVTGAFENFCSSAPFYMVGKWQTGTLAEPAAGFTSFGFKVTTGMPVYRLPGGAETELGGGGSLPSQAGNGGMFLTTDGADAAWAREIDKTRWIARMRDNFMRHTAASGSLGWTQGGTSGAGADGTSSSATFEHPGVYTYYAVYAGADKHTYLYLGYVGALGSNANWDAYYTFRTDPYVSTQGAYRIGFVKDGQEGANPPTDWFGLRYWNSSTCATNATDSYWTFEARAASTSTTSATATAQTTNQWLTVRMRSTTAGTIKFSLSTDDGETFSAETDIATNVPTDNLRPFVQRWGCTADTYYRVLMDEFMYEAWR